MFAFATRMIRDKYKTFIGYSLTAVAFLEMYIALFPAISRQASQFNQMLKTLPSAMFKAMNMDPSTLSFATLQSFLSTEYMSFLWPIMAIIFAISLANYISVNEIEKGTMEMLVSLPVNRIRVFTERYLTGLLIMASFSIISLLSAVPLARLQGISYISANYVTATIGTFFFVWAVYSLAILFSVIFSEKGRASMASGGILIFMYVMSIIANLQDNLKNIQYFSFFHYFNGSDLLAKNVYPENSLLVLGGFAIAATLISTLIFKRRDLSV